jgi:hypothetical protein
MGGRALGGDGDADVGAGWATLAPGIQRAWRREPPRSSVRRLRAGVSRPPSLTVGSRSRRQLALADSVAAAARTRSSSVASPARAGCTSVNSRTSEELVRYTALPAETGPTWAPDRLSIWPVEGGRYGIDAHYHGATGSTRAERQAQRLATSGLGASVRTDSDGGVVRLGPLAHDAIWIALEAFLGRPLPKLA